MWRDNRKWQNFCMRDKMTRDDWSVESVKWSVTHLGQDISHNVLSDDALLPGVIDCTHSHSVTYDARDFIFFLSYIYFNLDLLICNWISSMFKITDWSKKLFWYLYWYRNSSEMISLWYCRQGLKYCIHGGMPDNMSRIRLSLNNAVSTCVGILFH